MPLQAGDLIDTVADITDSQQDFNYNPTTDISVGLSHFVDWYKNYHAN